MGFGTSCVSAAEVVKEVRKAYKKTLIVKLTPNVTNISEIALAVESEGADSVSLINTLLGMAIDAETQKPILSTVTGGLSGPCVKPVALRMVWQVSKAVKIPVVGLGGIMNATDAIEFFLAGATAIQIGTANFINPRATVDVLEGIIDYCQKYNDLCKQTSERVSPGYLNASMSYWDYGFTVGLSKYRWNRILNLPYSPHALDFYLLGNTQGFRSSLVIS